jgi:AcrR family transcriptional regulator
MVLAQRARNVTQKNQRRLALTAAARELFQKHSFSQISMADVAQKTGMAKGTVFLYFKTKEELFFSIAVEEFQLWLDDMDRLFRGLARGRKKITPGEFLKNLGAMLSRYTLLMHMIAIFHTVLEHNISYADSLRFKQLMYDRLPKTGTLMEQCLPGLKPGQGFKFILWMYALVIGFTHMAEPAPVVREVYRKKPALRSMQLDFHESYFSALKAILDGWLAQNRRTQANPRSGGRS